MDVIEGSNRRIVGGVDTHKDLHVAAVVDEQDCVLATQSFAATRQGYRQMLAWMQSFGEIQRIGIESTGSYGAGLLRFVQDIGIEVLEVTTPDKRDRRRRGTNDDLDAQTPLVPPSPAREQSRHEAAMAWSNPCAFSRFVARQLWQHGVSPRRASRLRSSAHRTGCATSFVA
jgi:Transposase